MRTRPFEVEDVAWIAPLAESLFSDFDHGYGDAVARWSVDPAVVGWVVEGPTGPVGFAFCGMIGLVGEGQPRVLDLLAIGVRPEQRRLGIGRMLLSRVLQHARQDAGAREVRLTVAADNASARAMFEQAGFKVDRPDDGTFPGGQRAVRMTWRPRR